MINFKEFILIEKAEILSKEPGRDIALSVNPRNINVAKIELSKLIKSNDNVSTGIDRDDMPWEIQSLRGLYDITSHKFYVWFAFDSIHDDVIRKLNLINDETVHLSFIGKQRKTRTSPTGVLHGPLKNTYSVEEIRSWKDTISKFVGKVIPLDDKMFDTSGR